jgi:hypothetical protein
MTGYPVDQDRKGELRRRKEMGEEEDVEEWRRGRYRGEDMTFDERIGDVEDGKGGIIMEEKNGRESCHEYE